MAGSIGWFRWQYTLVWRRLLAEATTNAANRLLLKRASDDGWLLDFIRRG